MNDVALRANDVLRNDVGLRPMMCASRKRTRLRRDLYAESAPNPRTDSNRHTHSEAFQKSFPFKNYLQSHRCKGILDRFGIAKRLKCLQICGIIKKRKAVNPI